MDQQPIHRRRKKLIKPRIQLKLTMIFVGLSALSLLLQFVLFQSAVASTALKLPNDSIVLLAAANSMLVRVLAISFLVFLPLTFLVGILTTFRIAGPIYRFERFLEAVQRGESPPDFRLRKGDELVRLANLIIETTGPLREGQVEVGLTQHRDLDDPPSLARDETAQSQPRLETEPDQV